MKKLLLAAMSMAFVSNVYAADGADVKFSGEMRFRFTGAANSAFTESAHDTETVQRNKLGVHFTKSEDLMAHVTLLHAATWGNTGGTNTSGDLTAGDTDNDVAIYEAWAFWKAMDNFSVRLGRGALDIADGSVIAKNDWEQRPYAFEGALGTWYTEWANVNLFAVKGMNDTTESGTDDADVNFYGLSFDFKNLPEVLKMANLHVLQSKATAIDTDLNGDGDTADPNETDNTDSKMRIGLTLKGDVGGFDYRGTYAMYSGELELTGTTTTVDHKASMYDLEAGYTFPSAMNARLHVIYHSDSGDDNAADNNAEEYDPFFYESHSNAGLMDLSVTDWGNLTYYKVGLAVEPAEMVKAGVDYYAFTETEKVGTTDDVGNEIDVWATKTLSNGAELNARYGVFQPDDSVGTEDATQFSVGATFKF